MNIKEVKESLQCDLQCILDFTDQDVIDNACQAVVDRMNQITIGKKYTLYKDEFDQEGEFSLILLENGIVEDAYPIKSLEELIKIVQGEPAPLFIE